MKNEKKCAICHQAIAKGEKVAYRVNLSNDDKAQDVCCMDCFLTMEEDYNE